MTALLTRDDNMDVFRDIIKERRNSFYVTYQAADSRYPFALLNLVYPDSVPDRERISEHMAQEMAIWLERFPVPLMVSAFDATDVCLEVHEPAESHLMGYFDPGTSSVVSRWGTFNDEELPTNQSTPKYLSTVYAGVPFRLKATVRKQADEKAAQLSRGIRLFRVASVFWVGIPLLVEIISLGINWIGYALWSISVSVGLFKFAKILGWVKPSARQLAKDEEMGRMKHYYYHCERNPAGFTRIKIENFERDAIEETRRDFDSLPSPKQSAG